jgi:hypothetical protein
VFHSVIGFQDESERAELVLHPVAVAVAQLPFAAVERGPGDR